MWHQGIDTVSLTEVGRNLALGHSRPPRGSTGTAPEAGLGVHRQPSGATGKLTRLSQESCTEVTPCYKPASGGAERELIGPVRCRLIGVVEAEQATKDGIVCDRLTAVADECCEDRCVR